MLDNTKSTCACMCEGETEKGREKWRLGDRRGGKKEEVGKKGDKETGRQKDRETDRQRDTEEEIEC